MKTGFYFPTQSAPTAQWIPNRAPNLPRQETLDYPQQLVGETAGGTVHVQDLGGTATTFELLFERVTQEERNAALSFYQVVKKAFNPFEYVDAAGAIHSVRWLNAFELKEVVVGRFSGTVQLRKE